MTTLHENGHAANHDAAEAIAALQRVLKPQMDEARVLQLIAENAPAGKARELSITIADRPSFTTEGAQHSKMVLVLTALANNINILLVGETGSGKTSAAHISADVLGLPFYSQSFCSTTSKSDLLGYMNANGDYVTTNFRRAFEFGGVFCADEFDSGNANTNAVLNQALANGSAGFPDGMVKKHEDFLIVACANTYGKGATARYVGRNKLDAATLDRFATIRFDIDESLEASLIGIDEAAAAFDIADGGTIAPGQWLKVCRAARNAANEIGAEVIVSPRAVQMGARLLAAGVGYAHCLEMLIYKGADATTRAKLADHIETAARS